MHNLVMLIGFWGVFSLCPGLVFVLRVSGGVCGGGLRVCGGQYA